MNLNLKLIYNFQIKKNTSSINQICYKPIWYTPSYKALRAIKEKSESFSLLLKYFAQKFSFTKK